MWGLPSGNHLIWIRPQFQSVDERLADIRRRYHEGKIDRAQGVLEQIRWGDEESPPDTKSWFSVAYDPNYGFWVARANPDICQGFLNARTGSAHKSGENLHLFNNGPGAALELLAYQFSGESTAKLFGNAMREPVKNQQGNQTWKWRTRFLRQLDMAAMMPQERLAEMIEGAVRDPNFSSEMKKEFGALGDPAFLLAMAVVFGIFVGIGAGAYALGGAAFAAAISKLLGASMVAMQIGSYVTLYHELQRCCFSDKQNDFLKGVKTVQQILEAAVKDIAVILSMGGAVKAIGKAAQVFKTLFVSNAPAKWIEAANAGKGEAEALLAKLRARIWGYNKEELLKPVKNVAEVFQSSESSQLLAKSARNREMIVIRAPSPTRMKHLKGLNRWVIGKPTWVKGKSGSGWLGMLCGKRNGTLAQALAGQAAKPYPMGQLKGAFPELDEVIARHKTLDSYELPTGTNCLDEKGVEIFDWYKAGTEIPDPNKAREAAGWRAIDLNKVDKDLVAKYNLKDKLLLVDRLGQPMIQDIDVGDLRRFGTPEGPKVPEPNTHRGSVEDAINVRINEEAGSGVYEPFQHPEATAQAHPKPGQPKPKKYFSVRLDNGSFIEEELYVFLPFRRSGWSSALFKFKGWKEFETFCHANHIPFAF